jgi:hypothetical protein
MPLYRIFVTNGLSKADGIGGHIPSGSVSCIRKNFARFSTFSFCVVSALMISYYTQPSAPMFLDSELL